MANDDIDERNPFAQDLTPVTMLRIRAGFAHGAVEVVRGFVPSVDNVQAEVGGYFEFVYEHNLNHAAIDALCAHAGITHAELHPQKSGLHRLVLAVNEYGAITDPPLPVNVVATSLVAGLAFAPTTGGIAGDAILLEID